MSIVRELANRAGIQFLTFFSGAGGILGILYNYNGRIFDSVFIIAAVVLSAFALFALIVVIITDYFGLVKNRQIEADAARLVARAQAREEQIREQAQVETRAHRAQMAFLCHHIISGQTSVRCSDIERLQTIIQQGNADQAECKLLLQQWFYDYHLNLANQNGPAVLENDNPVINGAQESFV